MICGMADKITFDPAIDSESDIEQTTPELIAKYDRRKFAYTAGSACHGEREPWYRMWPLWAYPLAFVGLFAIVAFFFILFGK
jgi:hypothetical protein